MNKIDIRDLRVGNLIYHKDCPIPLQVSGVKDGEVYLKHSFAHNRTVGFVRQDRPSMCNIDEIKSIPLTKEILEKNGFVENRGITSWKFETKREDLIDIYGVNDYHLSINIEDTHGSGKGYRWMLNNLVIFYVHQLQNILLDLRIEKEITI